MNTVTTFGILNFLSLMPVAKGIPTSNFAAKDVFT